MPKTVACYRTYQAPKLDAEGKAATKDGAPVMETVTERHMRYTLDAEEAVRNGKGEWSMTEPKTPVTHVASEFDVKKAPEKKAKNYQV